MKILIHNAVGSSEEFVPIRQTTGPADARTVIQTDDDGRIHRSFLPVEVLGGVFLGPGEPMDPSTTAGDQVYKNIAGDWAPARADVQDTLKQGMCVDAAGGLILLYGRLSSPAHGLPVGSTWYLDPSNAGGVIPEILANLSPFRQAVFEVLDGDVLKVVDQAAAVAGAGGGPGVSTWQGLTDTPASYLGTAGMSPEVNTAETGLVLSSVKALLNGDASQIFRVSDGVAPDDAVNVRQLSSVLGGLAYIGLWTPNAVSYPDETLVAADAGDFWICDADGTDKDGRLWLQGWWAIFNGSNSPVLGISWDQVDPQVNVTFLDLLDTPGSYTSEAGRKIVVDPAETQMVYKDDDLLGLTDVIPTFYTGFGGQALRVNAAETGVEFTPFPTGGAGGGIADWLPATSYAIGDYVRFPTSDALYRCVTAHVSSADFLADLAAGLWAHLSGHLNVASDFEGGLVQQTIKEQVLYEDGSTPLYNRPVLAPVAQNPPMTNTGGWTLSSSPLLTTPSVCDPTKFERRHISWAGTYFVVGEWISFGGTLGNTTADRWKILRVGRTGGNHYCEVSPDECNVPCLQSPNKSVFETWAPAAGDYIDPITVASVTDLGTGEFEIVTNEPFDKSGTVVLDDAWQADHAILPYDTSAVDTYLVIKSIINNTTFRVEPDAALPTIYKSEPSGWVPTVGMRLRTSGVVGPLAQIIPSAYIPRVPVEDAELANKKYVDDAVDGAVPEGVLTGRHEGSVAAASGSFIRLAGPFTPTSGAHFEVHWQFPGGVQGVIAGSWSSQFNVGELHVETTAGAGLGGNYVQDIRIRRLNLDGGLYLGYVLDSPQTVEAINVNIKYTQQGRHVPQTYFEGTNQGGADIDKVSFPLPVTGGYAYFSKVWTPTDGTQIPDGSHGDIEGISIPADWPTTGNLKVEGDLGCTTNSGNSDGVFWVRCSHATGLLQKGAMKMLLLGGSTRKFYIRFCMVVPYRQNFSVQMRLDGLSGNPGVIQGDNTNGYSRITVTHIP